MFGLTSIQSRLVQLVKTLRPTLDFDIYYKNTGSIKSERAERERDRAERERDRGEREQKQKREKI